MKKFVTAIFAVMIVAVSCVTAFAAPSPQANVIPNGSGSNAVADSGPKSPQTGSSDVLPYALMGLSRTLYTEIDSFGITRIPPCNMEEQLKASYVNI